MGKKVLVAESDSTVQQVVSYFLKLDGFDVTMAGDGVSALEMLETFQPDLVLLDPDLSGISGIEVSRLVRGNPLFGDRPILFLVEKDEVEKVPEGFGVVHKPIDPTKMVNAVREYMEKGQPKVAVEGESVREERSPGRESISIEELLGWEITGDNRVEDTKQPPSIAAEPVSGVIEKGLTEAQESVEADIRERITDEMIREIVSRIAAEAIERVARDVVPRVAVEEVKKEIERLKGEGG